MSWEWDDIVEEPDISELMCTDLRRRRQPRQTRATEGEHQCSGDNPELARSPHSASRGVVRA